jgi:hypothetical protein
MVWGLRYKLVRGIEAGRGVGGWGMGDVECDGREAKIELNKNK